MPIVNESGYRIPRGFGNGHLQTIFPFLFRQVPSVTYKRTRWELEDGDFLDLDWLIKGNEKLAIVLHGLESNSDESYMRGMVKHLSRSKFDVVVLNFRSCSGEMNRTFRTYHSGETTDIQFVVETILRQSLYSQIHLVGFSLGGNVTLKFLGEMGGDAIGKIASAVAISVPVHLESCADELKKWENAIYMQRFLFSLKRKAKKKLRLFPGKLNPKKFHFMKSFHEFDEYFTAPVHGFSSAQEYWNQSSSLGFLSEIKIPTLLLNAVDDPFLSEKCFPSHLANDSEHFHLEEVPS